MATVRLSGIATDAGSLSETGWLPSDGLIRALQPELQVFITSPNMESAELPAVILGEERPLYRRRDGRYSLDNPCQHPQPFNVRYPYMTCMRTPPEGKTFDWRDSRKCTEAEQS